MRVGQMYLALAGIAVAFVEVQPAGAALVVYTDRAVFRAAAPGLPVEDFEAPLIGAFTGVLNSTTNNSLYAPGDILPGVTFSSPGLIGLATLAPYMGVPSISLSTANRGAALFIDFDPVSAAGFTLLSPQHELPGTSAPIQVDVYSASGLIGSSQFAVDRFGSFVGFISNGSPIVRITLTPNDGEDWAALDDIEFGQVPEPRLSALVFLMLASLVATKRRLQ